MRALGRKAVAYDIRYSSDAGVPRAMDFNGSGGWLHVPWLSLFYVHSASMVLDMCVVSSRVAVLMRPVSLVVVFGGCVRPCQGSR